MFVRIHRYAIIANTWFWARKSFPLGPITSVREAIEVGATRRAMRAGEARIVAIRHRSRTDPPGTLPDGTR